MGVLKLQKTEGAYAEKQHWMKGGKKVREQFNVYILTLAEKLYNQRKRTARGTPVRGRKHEKRMRKG